MTATRGPAVPAPTGSTTQLDTTPHPLQGQFPLQVGTLRLRAETRPRRGIRWAEDVVNNEGLGRKSSKVCCIYHKARAVGESSSEDDSSSSSDSDSDSEPDNSTARKAGDKGKAKHAHDHDHDERCRHEDSEPGLKSKSKKKGRRKKSPNAYEKMPKKGGTVTQTMK